MKKRGIGIVLIAVMAAAFLLFPFLSGCASEDVGMLRLEAESAVVEGTPYGSAALFVQRAESISENVSSGKKFVSNFGVKGNTLSWVFSARQGETDLYFRVASASAAIGGFDVSEAVELTVNSKKVELGGFNVGAASKYCDSWQTLKVENVPVEGGFNKVVLTALGETYRINVDYLAVDTDKAEIDMHEHIWDTYTERATCTVSGGVYRECKECKISYLFSSTKATGHLWSNYHFDEASGKMMRVCLNGCGEKGYTLTPDTEYYGEVFDDPKGFSVKPHVELYEAEDANVDISVGGLNNGTSYVESVAGASGGKIVANISKPGNFVEFTVRAENDCRADIVLVCANTLYTTEGIGVLDPLSRYMSLTVEGENVDLGYVAFPGNETYDYYDWHYVVVKNIRLHKGENSIVYKPITQVNGEFGKPDNWVTVPNLDVLMICTDEPAAISLPKKGSPS